MPRVLIEAPAAPPVDVDEPQGGRLVDICDDASAPVPFSCRGASCGTCLVEVIEGEALLDSPGDEEGDLLALLGEGPGRRLACAASVRPGPGLLRLRVP